jgi:hypothetical protein
MKKSSIILGLAFGFAAASNASAQSKAPDALDDRYYRDTKDVFKNFDSYLGGSDSLVKRFKGVTTDSIRVDAHGNLFGSGTVQMGTLLDNRSESDSYIYSSESDSYIYNGTRYFIRNAKPLIDPKEVRPGSNIYMAK